MKPKIAPVEAARPARRRHDIKEALGLCPEAMARLILYELRWFLRDPLVDFDWRQTVEFAYRIYDVNREFRKNFPRTPKRSLGYFRTVMCHWLANSLARQFPYRPLVLPFEFVWRGAWLGDFPRPTRWNGGAFPEDQPIIPLGDWWDVYGRRRASAPRRETISTGQPKRRQKRRAATRRHRHRPAA
jgi:hypothetical protein